LILRDQLRAEAVQLSGCHSLAQKSWTQDEERKLLFMTTESTPTQGGRIDLHHHFFPTLPGADPTAFADAALKATGWIVPPGNMPWSPELAIAAMDQLGVEKAVFSAPTGGLQADEANRKMVRFMNDTAHSIVEQHPDRFAFFATIPVPLDPNAALDELAYAVDELGAVGLGIPSSYGVGDGAHYLGSDALDPLWEELNRRESVVFVHGDQTPNSNRWPNKFLGLPVTEVPNETYKAAADLVTTGKKNALDKVKIILAHSGGSTPYLASRVAGLSSYLGSSLNADEIIESFQTFYYETALSGFKTNLAALESFVAPDHIMFGTDFPAITVETAQWYTSNVDRYFESRPEMSNAVARENALAILPSLA
jgi:6-methylsalicylate decarboxylase